MRKYNLGDILIESLIHQDREVKIIVTDSYGFHITIDGTQITQIDDEGDVSGLPWELFEVDMDDFPLTEESESLIEDIYALATEEEL